MLTVVGFLHDAFLSIDSVLSSCLVVVVDLFYNDVISACDRNIFLVLNEIPHGRYTINYLQYFSVVWRLIPRNYRSTAFMFIVLFLLGDR